MTGRRALRQGKRWTADRRAVIRVVGLTQGEGRGVAWIVSSTWPRSRQTSSVV